MQWVHTKYSLLTNSKFNYYKLKPYKFNCQKCSSFPTDSTLNNISTWASQLTYQYSPFHMFSLFHLIDINRTNLINLLGGFPTHPPAIERASNILSKLNPERDKKAFKMFKIMSDLTARSTGRHHIQPTRIRIGTRRGNNFNGLATLQWLR